MNWTAWVHEPGLAPVWHDFTTLALNESIDLADQYVALEGKGSPPNADDYKGWYSSLRVIFLERLNSNESTNKDIMAQIDTDLQITSTLDPECKRVWYSLGIAKGYTEVIDAAHTFISSMGRMKYLKPIYQALLDNGQKDVALQWYEENKNFYHPYCVTKLGSMLGVPENNQKKDSYDKYETMFLQD